MSSQSRVGARSAEQIKSDLEKEESILKDLLKVINGGEGRNDVEQARNEQEYHIKYNEIIKKRCLVAKLDMKEQLKKEEDVKEMEKIKERLITLDEELKKYKLKDETGYRYEETEKGREIFFPKEVYGVVNGEKWVFEPVEKWGLAGKGTYKESISKDEDGRYKVAVGPKIIDSNYPDNGKIWTSDFEGFSDKIDVVLQHITTGELKTINCRISDRKAHSYNKYLEGHSYNTGDDAWFYVENGIMQTGIAYPNSTNAGKDNSCSVYHMDGSVVEFAGQGIDFPVKEYKLVKIIVLKKE